MTVLFLFTGCKALKIDRAAVTTEADWLTEGDSPERRNVTEDAVVPPLEEVWVYNATAAFGSGSPLLLGQNVLVGTRKGEIHAIDFETGKRKGIDNFGETVEGTPIIQDGKLIVPVGWGKRMLYVYDLANARTLWKLKGTPIETGILSLGEAFVVADAQAHVRKYDTETGEVRWEYVLDEGNSVHATPVLARERVIIAGDRGDLVALRPDDGTVHWKQALRSPVYTSISAHETALFVPTTRGRIFALDAEGGRVRWTFALPDTTIRFAAPAVDGDLLVVGASDGLLRALDTATGALRWSFKVSAALTAAPLLTPRHVYIGSMGRMLYAVDRETGAKQWEHQLRGRVKSALAARDGYLVVLSEPHFVYLFRSTSAPDHAASL
ncbi:MAG: PQQ-binding-like beta-propeller repeat protein [Rhodothermales bacterium]